MPGTWQWKEVRWSGTAPCARDCHAAVAVPDGVFFFGGTAPDWTHLQDAQCASLLSPCMLRVRVRVRVNSRERKKADACCSVLHCSGQWRVGSLREQALARVASGLEAVALERLPTELRTDLLRCATRLLRLGRLASPAARTLLSLKRSSSAAPADGTALAAPSYEALGPSFPERLRDGSLGSNRVVLYN